MFSGISMLTTVVLIQSAREGTPSTTSLPFIMSLAFYASIDSHLSPHPGTKPDEDVEHGKI